MFSFGSIGDSWAVGISFFCTLSGREGFVSGSGKAFDLELAVIPIVVYPRILAHPNDVVFFLFGHGIKVRKKECEEEDVKLV